MNQLTLFGEVVDTSPVQMRSPFRYPGGKSWFVPRLRQWIGSMEQKPKLLIEPFAGGGSIGLTAAFEDLAERVIMAELDPQIAAVWLAIFSRDAKQLADMILHFPFSPEAVAAQLAKEPENRVERAFNTILLNRVNRGGVMAGGAGMIKSGENGKGLSSRWYPETLAKRIIDIGEVKDKISFYASHAFTVIAHNLTNPEAVFFIDPPYTAGGKNAGARLYNYYEIDHDELFRLCSFISGDFIMTYDNNTEVKALAHKYRFATEEIAMRNAHNAPMTELIISKRPIAL